MRILWVSNHSPFQVDFGGGQRSNLIYRTLREFADVDVLIIGSRGDGRPLEELYGNGEGHLEVVQPTSRGARFPWRIVRPTAPGFVDRVAYNLGRIVTYCCLGLVFGLAGQSRAI